MKILIVEDDDYKLERIKAFAKSELGDISVDESESLKEALEAITDNTYDLIFIDMAIPSHPTIAGQGTPVSFNTGGLEVIMELAATGSTNHCVILTQYPDIEISGDYIPINQVKEKLPELLECNIAACILYEEDNENWQTELKAVLRDILR